METRNVTLTLDKAKEFYNSGNDALREVALQAFTENELKEVHYTDIKTFEDACKALGLSESCVHYDLAEIGDAECGLGKHLAAIYKLDIIRKALNGSWEPELSKGDIYRSWVRCYLPNKKPSDKKTIATLKADGQKYLLVGGCDDYGCCTGLGYFFSGYGYSNSSADLGLLCCKSGEIAQYMSTQFGKYIFDACYAQHLGAYEWV